jgi:hypothetical protein
MLDYFSTRDACNILGNFQDLICLKTAQGLVAQGLQATKMRNGVESLKKKFPGADSYLANKRVYVFGSHAIIRHKDRFIANRD